jgi:hypothetical protein
MKQNILTQKKYFDIFLIIILGLTPLLWFKSGYLIAGAEFEVPLNPIDNFQRLSYIWDDRIVGGHDNAQWTALIFPYAFFWYIFKILGFSVIAIEKLWFILLFVLPGLSMYYLSLYLTNKRVVALVSSFFYMINPYVLIQWHEGHMLSFLLYGILPLILAMYIKGLDTNKTKFYVYIAVISLIAAPMGSSPPFIISFGLVFLIYLVFRNSINKFKFFINDLKFTSKLILLTFLINSWWIFPLFNNIAHLDIQPQSQIINHKIFKPDSLYDVFALTGYWAFRDSFNGIPYFSLSSIYNSTLFLILSLLILVLVFSALVFKKQNIYTLYFFLLALIGVFLVNGINLPLGTLYKWAIENVPGFWIFREPYTKFAPFIAVGYSFLLGISVENMSNFFKNKKLYIKKYSNFLKYFFVFTVVIVILIYSWPLFHRETLFQSNSLRDYHVKIPKEYSILNEQLKNDRDSFKVFLLPYRDYVKYKWGWQGGPLTTHILEVPQITDIPGPPGSKYTINSIRSIYDDINTNKNINLAEVLGKLNVKYIVLSNDVDTEFYNVKGQAYVKQFLQSQNGISFIKNIGNQDVYENSKFIPLIYATSIDKSDLLEEHKNIRTLDDFEKDWERWEATFDDGLIAIPSKLFVKNGNYSIAFRTSISKSNVNYSWWKNKKDFGDLTKYKDGLITLWVYIPNKEHISRIRYSIGSDSINRIAFFLNSSYMNDGWNYWLMDLNNPQEIEGEIDWSKITLNEITIEEPFKPRNTVIFVDEAKIYSNKNLAYLSLDELNGSTNILPQINFTKINPTKYYVGIKNARNPFFLVFSESYHPQWRAYIGKKRLLDKQHFLINDYANSWYIDKLGSYRITLHYLPQTFFKIGVLISGVVLIVCLAYLYYDHKKCQKES